jgi:hypothetical protein
MSEEEIGCPPVASTSAPAQPAPKRAPKITVVKADGTAVGEAPTAAVPADTAAGEAASPDEAAAAASAPKRRGRPKGSSNGKTAKPRQVAPVSGATCRVTAAVQLAAEGPDGKVYFDRVLTGTGTDAEAANRVLAIELTEMYKVWEKIYLG